MVSQGSIIDEGIIVNWFGEREYIRLSFDALEELLEITSTIAWQKDTKKFVRYNTNSSVHRLSHNIIELILEYKHENNSHIRHEDACWGHSVITIRPGKLSGKAKWVDDSYNKYNGIVEWKYLNNGLTKPKKQHITSSIQRCQTEFRDGLLAYDGCCAITGERTSDTLEAAHIIPSESGGAEVLQNGILLRADLHRLYDSGKFSFDLSSGRVVEVRGVSQEYDSLLRSAKIPPEVFNRVRLALERRSLT